MAKSSITKAKSPTLKRVKTSAPVPPSTGAEVSPPSVTIVPEVMTEEELIREKDLVLSPPRRGKNRVRPSWATAEKTLHSAAFEYYYQLGSGRNLQKVADYFQVAIQTAQTWSSKFKWVRRVEERIKLDVDDTKLHKQAEVNKVKKAVLDYIGEKLKAHVTYDKDGNVVIKNGPEVRTIKEMAEAVALYRELLGETDKGSAGNSGQQMQVNFVISGRK